MRKFLLIAFYLLPLTILAQTPLGIDCTNPPLSADCGDLNPTGGLAPGSPTVFCEGEVVNFVNSTPASTVDSTIYCWGDGSFTVVRGVAGASHIYSFPRDTCLPSNRNISVIVRMIVFKRCGEDVSINWIATPISIRVKPKVLFTASDSVGCIGQRFNFTNNTCSNSPSAIYTWHFGNGDSIRSTSTNVQHIFNQTGRHIVRLVVNNGCGNIENNSLIEVRDTPSVSYGVITNNNGNCIPFDVSFRSSSTNIDTYSWAITGGSGATYINNTTRYSQNPTIRFTELGTYNIRLSGVGCRSTSWDTTITTNMQPIVTLANINDSCTSVTFDPNRVVSYGGGDATAYSWTFVGGIPPVSNLRYPAAQRFTQAGQYSVRVEASNLCGISRDTVNFAVTPVPKVNVGVSNITSCIPFDINFTNTSPQTGGFQWTISGGTGYSFLNNTNINSPSPNIRFSSLGTYRIQGITQNCATFQFDTLITTNTLPQVALARVSDSCQSATIDPSRIVTYSGGTPSLYQWTFAGGTPPFSNLRTPSVQNYNQAGQYSIKIEVSNVCGTAKDSFGFRVMSLEALRLTPVPPLCNTNQPVRLTATPTGGTWIGKGVSSSGFFYPANADLGQNTVTYSYGTGRCAVSANMQIMVGGANINPGADVSICADAPAFNLTGHSPTGGKWTGVGVVDSTRGIFSPSVSGVGRRILTYTYTDPVSRCVNTGSRIVNVNTLPQAIIDNLPNACVGISLPFRNLSQNISTAQWSFGDGTTSNAINATHIYNAAGSYNVNLTVQNSFGCSHSTAKNILIDKQGLAEFTKSTNGGCGDLLSATFYNNSQGNNLKYLWRFGNGQTDTSFTPPTIRFKQASLDTTYIITLMASNSCGTSIKNDSVIVRPRPVMNFGFQNDGACSPMTVRFANVSTGMPTSYLWDMGNGLRYTDSIAPIQVYKTDSVPRTYRITLIGTNACGTDTVSRLITVAPANVKPFFYLPQSIGCVPMTIKATNFATAGSRIYWTISDGNSSSAQDTLIYTFNKIGSYIVTQYANNGCGYDSLQATIDVRPAPSVGFKHIPNVCMGQPITFTDTSSSAVSVVWHLGDGNTSVLQNAQHIYQRAGAYTVRLVGTDLATSCSAEAESVVAVRDLPKAAFIPSPISGCPPLSVRLTNLSERADYFSWDFGETNVSMQRNPVHVYDSVGNYNIRLRATDLYGCFHDTIFRGITVHPVPIADFDPMTSSLCGLPARYTMVNRTQFANSFEWQLGDGNISSATHPVVNYNRQGYFNISLLASNSFGCKDTVEKIIRTAAQPFADFDITVKRGCQPVTVTFQNRSQNGTKHLWLFDDGTLDTTQRANFTHIYDSAGYFSPTLIVSNQDLCFDTLTLPKAVKVSGKPKADFIYEEEKFNDKPTGTLLFTNTSLNAVTYRWDFNDNTTTTEKNPQKRFLYNGTKNIRLIVRDSLGCVDTLSKEVTPQYLSTIFVPNAFSPENGVGEQAVFFPKGVGLKEYRINVFSTYGKLVWTSDKLDRAGMPAESWNGRLMNEGEVLPQDTYVWEIERAIFEDGTRRGKISGTVMLLR